MGFFLFCLACACSEYAEFCTSAVWPLDLESMEDTKVES